MERLVMAEKIKIYFANNGDVLIISSGGKITVEGGGVIDCSAATGSLLLANGEITAADLASNAVPTSKINNGAVTSPKLAQAVLQVDTISLTNVNIKALNASPKELVAAPGAGKVIEFVSAMMVLDYGSDVLTESADNMAIEYDDGSGLAVTGVIESTGFIDAAADTIKTIIATEIANDDAADMVNKNLVLVNNGDEFAGNATADTTIKVVVSYRVHTTGL